MSNEEHSNTHSNCNSVSLKTSEKCFHCLQKRSMKMNCKFCDNLLCLRCMQPEVHSCANLRRMKDDLIKKLELKLSSERCVKSKIESI